MQLICSYCRTLLREDPDTLPGAISHGICKPCRRYFEEQWAGLTMSEYLDRFDLPVALVEAGQGRIVALNERMAETLGRPRDEMAGLLGGEAMECVYARLPEGCGNTVHCEVCTVRNLVQDTFADGQPRLHQPAYVERDDGRLDLVLSARRKGEVIELVIDEVTPG